MTSPASNTQQLHHLINASDQLQLQLQLGHLADAFIQSDLHRLIHALTHRRQSQTCKGTASSSGAVRVKCLAQGRVRTNCSKKQTDSQTSSDRQPGCLSGTLSSTPTAGSLARWLAGSLAQPVWTVQPQLTKQ